MVTFILILSVVLIGISGIAKAVQDKVDFHYSTSIFVKYNPLFWNPDISSNNKYKNGNSNDGAKFLGSTTFLVWTTDAWHLFQFTRNLTYTTGTVLLGYLCIPVCSNPFIWLPSAIAFAWGFQGLIFEWFFSKVFEN